ncbi:MAG: BLUF domain-containing protein [Actinomycetota bacterium]|nr:BLUF domain-containing protein [Actinomycetota bacterium]
MDSATDGEVFRLIYRSRNRIVPARRKTALGDLFSEARSNNKKRNVTGALLISGDWFAQTLEGDEETVRSLFATIERDSRHEHISILAEQTVPGRLFSRWAMARVSADGGPDIPLIAHTDGISPAASRGTTPEQESVLAIMREATHGDAHAV